VPDDAWLNGQDEIIRRPVINDDGVGVKVDENGDEIFEEVTVRQKVRAMVNIGAEGRVVRGAIWQAHEREDAAYEAQEAWNNDLLDLIAASGITVPEAMRDFQQGYLKPRFVARGLPTQILDWDGPVPVTGA
jgi:hypothetical protein